jgi:hypothetical protein
MDLSKIVLARGPYSREPGIIRLPFRPAIRILRFSENFFLLAPGAFCRPDPERLTRPRVWVRDSGDDRDRTGNLRLAKPALSQLSYVPGPQGKSEISNLRSQIWNWARVDSDYRPHAYQACALTN